MLSQLELVKARRQLAESKGQMNTLWGVETSPPEQDPKEEKTPLAFQINYRNDALKSLVKILQDTLYMDKLVDSFGLLKSLAMMQQLHMEALLSFGNIQPNVSFNSLAMTQHMHTAQQQLGLYNHYSQFDSQFQVLQKQIKSLRNQSIQNSQFDIKGTAIYQKIMDIPNNAQMYKHLPQQSTYLLIHQSPDKRHLFVGFLRMWKQNKRDYLVIKEELSQEKYQEVNQLIRKIKKIKDTLIKIPITTEAEWEAMEARQEEKYQKVLAEMESFCSFFTPRIDRLINKQYSYGEQVKSLSVLVDQEIEAIPFEHLQVFNDIKAKSKDFSLYQLANKFKQRDADSRSLSQKNSDTLRDSNFSNQSNDKANQLNVQRFSKRFKHVNETE